MALTIHEHVNLSEYTTFHIGGPADYFVTVTTESELSEALYFAREQDLPVFVLSGGSNLLIADSGYRGLVIHLSFRGVLFHEGGRVTVAAGESLLSTILACIDHSLGGLEHMAGVPGSVGGAVRGNAGAFGTEIGDVVQSVSVYDTLEETTRVFTHEQCDFHYRSSVFKADRRYVILSVDIQLSVGHESADLEKVAADTRATREAKHPQDAWCAGSFFMNPVVTNPKIIAEFESDIGARARGGKVAAGWLIDHVGLRGKSIGGAKFSDQHPNYLVNTGTATAEDVVMLVSLVQQRVRDQIGVELVPEVEWVGF
jgi:UDP-N-acetylmuramate dehydrogenase